MGVAYSNQSEVGEEEQSSLYWKIQKRGTVFVVFVPFLYLHSPKGLLGTPVRFLINAII